MKQTGKIGRLSKDRRNKLAQRFENGETGAEIVNWLNAQPDVRKTLEAQFAGRPISEQNLSDWKQGGHLEWLRQLPYRLNCGLPIGHVLDGTRDGTRAASPRHSGPAPAT